MPTQTSDILNTAIDHAAIEFSLSPEEWTIAAGVLVGSTGQNGVVSDFDNSTLVNSGQIFSAASNVFGFTGRGVLFNNANGMIRNEISGVITGSNIGVEVQGLDTTINNLGSITGFSQGVYLGALSEDAQLNNQGNIYGHFLGVRQSSFGDSTIMNSGKIAADLMGIQVILTNNLSTTSITNEATGVIKGTTAAINTIVGAISLTNHGTVLGNIDCDAPGANDVVTNSGKIEGSVLLGSGNDVYQGEGSVTGLINGGDGSDQLYGGKDKDALYGGNDNDLLVGGKKQDLLFGDQGSDVFRFESIRDSRPGEGKRDTIGDYEAGDVIDLSPIDARAGKPGNQAFKFIGEDKFSDKAGELKYADGALKADVDGDGRADFDVRLTGNPSLSGDHLLL